MEEEVTTKMALRGPIDDNALEPILNPVADEAGEGSHDRIENGTPVPTVDISDTDSSDLPKSDTSHGTPVDVKGMPDEQEQFMNEGPLQTQPRWQCILNKRALPDDRFTAFGYDIVDGPAVVKFIKFLTVTYLCFFIAFAFVRWVDWENDEYYTMEQFWKFDSSFVVTDALFFFVVGRLNKQNGVDHLAWILPILVATLYSSGVTRLDFMQHSVSLYEMRCRWPPGLWIFAIIVTVFVVALVYAHIRYIAQQRKLFEKGFEISFCTAFFLVPSIASPFFHFHHWFAGWFGGMHFNLNVWWSRVTMAFLWGFYINGIAVYGRDPILGCEYSLYVSLYQRCSFMRCYVQGIIDGAGNATHPSNYTGIVTPFVPLDWRTCSTD
ncbi:predicted protein [Phaeodactylum tricornutum CCAP 1055/1]|jgi:hypothetical protein|uniref:Transmembrane protein n=2 Tax=Phaeodactylum tricornutum TaxID=2850 RepID=B7G7T5_PHATC|nr:predicted protein [Phaeodactylum tricornutum CCAP 1055/1]EEC45290.1 predicted protein [Phaeodactylum tricornutum CCAP 1055/1]|eukprot:XP_002183072.1 predicted protein [Phaeodactylum tricornutum CCAP 1055/1]